LVTGGSSGIGRATALTFAKGGAHVVIADMDDDRGDEVLKEIQAAGGDALYIHTDVSDDDSVKSMIQHAVATYGKLDMAVNNAGIEGVMVPTTEYPLETWHKVIAINLTGVWLCMKHEIPHLLKTEGVIVNTASVAGLVGAPNASAYAAAKHGVVGLTKTAALEYAKLKLRVNAVCPAFIETPMVMEREMAASTNQQTYDRLVRAHPMRRLGKPQEIADAIVWLCSDQTKFMTGHCLTIDGGLTAG
jgi:NAD(P)-dependent dehydrogenase (short-subunit alcohol dehydrogenase family)